MVTARYKQDLMIVPVPHGMALTAVLPLVQAGPENLSGLLGVVENPLPVSPPMGSKKQGHGIEFLPVRGRTVGVPSAVRAAGPGKIPLIPPLGHIHISLGPLPDPVKLLLHVQLHAHHHAVGHAFGAGVIVPRIHQVAHILPHGMVDPLLLAAVEKGLHDLFQLPVNLLLGNPDFRKHVAVGSV